MQPSSVQGPSFHECGQSLYIAYYSAVKSRAIYSKA